MHEYLVSGWGSNPNDGNDDCWMTVVEFHAASDAEATKRMAAITDQEINDRSVAFLELCRYADDTEGGGEVFVALRQILSDEQIAKDKRAMDDEWRREIAREEGMLGGCDAYNEVMGY